MAHYKRKKSRTSGCGHYSANGLSRRLDDKGVPKHAREKWYTKHPRCWDKVYHTQPARRKSKDLEKKVLRGVDADDVTWPDYRKPHIYYW